MMMVAMMMTTQIMMTNNKDDDDDNDDNLHGLRVPQQKLSVAVGSRQKRTIGRKRNARDSCAVTLKLSGGFEDTTAFQGEDENLKRAMLEEGSWCG